MQLSDIPEEEREKLIGDVFCISCQKSFRLENAVVHEFRGKKMIEGNCPQCTARLVKPVGGG